MKKKFKSKVDLLLLIPVLFILFAAEVFLILKGIFIALIAVGLIGGFLTYLYITTVYVVHSKNKLRIKSGFLFNREIYIPSIKKLRPSNDHTAWPALSLDRIEISYNRYGRIVVSPENKNEFIRELKELNPQINVEENKATSFYQSMEDRIEAFFSLKQGK